MSQIINWGIIGLGNIAHKFASDLQLADGAVLQGVASRSLDKAKAFALHHKSVSYYDDYLQLAKNPDVDIIYIATPNNYHFDHTMMCFEHGKSVLCEKPLGLNSNEVKAMIHKARSKDLFFMEGIWTRFIPAIKKFVSLLDQNAIGDLISIRSDFGFRKPFDSESRLFNKQLGAGSLLDIGIYPIYISYLTLGMPVDINAMARKANTDVDITCEMLLGFKNNQIANLSSTFEAHTANEAYVYGTKGKIKLHAPFHHPQKISVENENADLKIYELPYQGNGYVHEIEAVHKSLNQHQTENELVNLNDSSALMTIIDTVKKQIKLSYT
ncbi:MAG: Gfo/Idh/MocA family oxidoreductase [Psychroflexus sp.]|nr:Gfo/Idh/MocA family oxidoreductase [Psychroflexus sp.]MDR9448513.1 Gfo/Idh/MocA family oxidoreductase [Psychroflexus sp.]